jgi:hypothetical protein
MYGKIAFLTCSKALSTCENSELASDLMIVLIDRENSDSVAYRRVGSG